MSRKIKKVNENFDNVATEEAKGLRTCVDVPFNKANLEHDERKKEYEDALKENEEIANDTIPKDGETGKKVTSKVLKAMHLSESLFDEEMSFNKRNEFESAIYKCVIDVVKDHLWDGITVNDISNAFDKCLIYMEDDDELQGYGIFNESVVTGGLLESMEEIDRQVFGSLNKESREPGVYYVLVDQNFDHKIYADSDEEAIEKWHSEKENLAESIKYSIAEEKLQKFNEGLLSEGWDPNNYLDKLLKKNHLTESQVKQLKKRYL